MITCFKHDDMIPAGTTLMVTAGAYDDYAVIGVVSVVRDFRLEDVVDAWAEECGHDLTKPHVLSESKLFQWMVEQRIVAEIECGELHTFDYHTCMWREAR